MTHHFQRFREWPRRRRWASVTPHFHPSFRCFENKSLRIQSHWRSRFRLLLITFSPLRVTPIILHRVRSLSLTLGVFDQVRLSLSSWSDFNSRGLLRASAYQVPYSTWFPSKGLWYWGAGQALVWPRGTAAWFTMWVLCLKLLPPWSDSIYLKIITDHFKVLI